LDGAEKFVCRGEWRLGQFVVAELDGVANDDSPSILGEDPITTVVGQGRAHVEPVVAAVVPRPAKGGLAVDENSWTSGAHGSGVKVVGPKEVFPGQCWSIRAGTEKVEGEFRLGKEEVPSVRGKWRHHAGEGGQEVVFEGADGTFCCIPLVDVGRDQLEGAVVSGDGALETEAGLVVKYVDRGLAVDGSEACVDGLVGDNAVSVLFRGERSHEDGIGGGVERDHDVLVATACAGGEAAGVVGEEAREGELEDGDTWRGDARLG
jgi:hypothetical protein